MIKGKILNRFGGEYGTYVTGLGISEYMVFVGTKLIKVFMNINEFLAWLNERGYVACDGEMRI